ncbi:MAG: hypothetical protein DCC71_04775 [Proteobacteria bacterium]|nr:MAG: hypothetical protein DCC71_04775 [Pseudomonadota bacterium]
MLRALGGTLAGSAATVPMTIAMELLHRRLAGARAQALPPQQITEKTLRASGVAEHMEPSTRLATATAAHFGYGAAAGAVYAAVAPLLPGPPAARGALFGLGVWAGSYLGWLPAAGILPPATREPAGRNAMMIASHLVWGAALGLLLGRR